MNDSPLFALAVNIAKLVVPGRDRKEVPMTVSSLSEYVSYVSALRDEWFPNEQTWGPWFRGQTNAAWSLVPGLYRKWQRPGLLKRGSRNLEDELRQEFMVRAPSFTALRPQTSWGWYFLMQHSFAPTRLLDWTEGAFIALYFAVKDNKGDCDAAVWALEPWWLNKKVLGRSEVYCPEVTVLMAPEDISRYKPWLPDLYTGVYELPPLPVAMYPAYSAQRISVQRSCFTVHGSQVSPFEDLLKGEEPGLRKIVVLASAVKTIRKQLLTCGVDELAIYPDLDGLGRCLLSILQMETDGGGGQNVLD
jgi:hypothetical protein